MIEDLDFIIRAKNNDSRALEEVVVKYKALVCRIARSYYLLSGGDTDDLIQEGTIGLLKAVQGFDPQKNKSFAAYASFCINNNIKDALRRVSTDKNKTLNDAIYAQNDDDFTKITRDPFAEYIDKEEADHFYQRLSLFLKDYQIRILRLYLDGYSYREIAQLMQKTQKYIDNALGTIKMKIRKNISTFDKES